MNKFKVIWLITYEWKFGDYGCKIYQFLSAFTYYSNSNVVMAIGIDRLKVVYTSHIQGISNKIIIYNPLRSYVCTTSPLIINKCLAFSRHLCLTSIVFMEKY